MPTERIAQTFPDINSQGLNTSGTAAGVRSFPQPFVATASGVGIQLQNITITVPIGSLSSTDVLPTPVDITKSFIVFRGVNQPVSSVFHSVWRTRISFTSIVGSVASAVVTTRRVTGVSSLDVYYTVVTFTGVGGTSADIRIERCTGSTVPYTGCNPDASATCILGGAQLTAAELARALVIFRGVEFHRFPGGASACSRGTGTECQFHPEQCHGTLRLSNISPDTVLSYTRFTGGHTCPGGPEPTDH